jgi:hypothetical protein
MVLERQLELQVWNAVPVAPKDLLKILGRDVTAVFISMFTAVCFYSCYSPLVENLKFSFQREICYEAFGRITAS